jgi:Domain of unknown function (DUF4397)
MRRLTLALGGVLVATATALATAPLAAAQDTGTVYVVHGIPNTPVDVYVDGARALDNFEPATSAGPLQLPAGPHEVTIFPADAADGSGTPVIKATAELPAGANVSLVAHLSEAGEPTLTPFVNDVSKLEPGQARLVVRHTAAAPAVDVLAGGTAVISGLTNPNEKALDLPASTVSASVAAAGTTEPVIGPADLDLKEGTASFVHAIGSLEDKTLGLVVVTVTGLHSSPSGVPSGAPSGAPSDSGVPTGLAFGVIAGVAVIGLTIGRLRSGARR